MTSCLLPGMGSPSKLVFSLRGKNLLLGEQILSFKNRPPLEVVSSLRGKNLLLGEQIPSFKSRPPFGREEKLNDRVAIPESVPFILQVDWHGQYHYQW